MNRLPRLTNAFWAGYLLLSAILVCQLTPAWATSSQHTWFKVPVYFATTRNPTADHKDYSGARNLETSDKATQGVEYGIATVRIDDNSASIDSTSVLNLGWEHVIKNESELVEIEHLSRDSFYESLRKHRQNLPNEEKCVFIHGYNSSFDGAARCAAQLEIALDASVILFSWPSAGKTKDYTVDECNAEWSVRPFQVFMQGLEQNLETKNLITVSHSMGNRLINWYFQSRYDKANRQPSKFKEVVLTSPDIDRATFKNYFYKVAANSERTRIYISAKDVPLRFSKFVHGSSRTGEVLTRDENKWDLPGNIQGVQTINFTTVDSGCLGHSIQYKIIASMHKTNEPGINLIVKEDPSFKGTYLNIVKLTR